MTIASLVGLKPEVTFGKSEANASAIRFMTANAGRLVGVQFPQHICDRTKIYSVHLYKTIGELCGELTDSRSRTAAVLTIGSSNENAIATADEFKANTIFTILEA